MEHQASAAEYTADGTDYSLLASSSDDTSIMLLTLAVLDVMFVELPTARPVM